MKKISIGIIAHVDSGKTTLSEEILYKTGVIRTPGSVNKKSSNLDTNEIERERGITIFSSGAVFTLDDTEITLIDTPGHVDFSPETERAMQIIDCAILVISATDGVQSHTTTLWRLLEYYKIPTIIFINKTDISALSAAEIMTELKYKLSDNCISFSPVFKDTFSDELAMCSERLIELFSEGREPSENDISEAVFNRNLHPCFFGSALKDKGVDALLSGLKKYVKAPVYSEKFGAKVYKINQLQSEKIAHLKLTGGSLKVKDSIKLTSENGEEITEKINQIRIYQGEKFRTVNEVYAGDVCAVTGLSGAYAGQGLGFESDFYSPMLEPLLRYTVNLPKGTDLHQVLPKFKKLEEEEPQLRIIPDFSRNELYFGIMGDVQLEVLTRIIKERFDLSISFSNGTISYRETIKSATIGIGHYEPLRHYAEVQLLLEPLERGKGVVFDVDPECTLDGSYRRLVLSHLREKVHIGALTGSPITDIKITLLDGKAHPKHTEGGDFRQATFRAVRQGLRSAMGVLLEPWCNFTLEIPSSNIGRAMTDITKFGGDFSGPELLCGDNSDIMVLSGSVPAAKIQGYHRELAAYTGGVGRLMTTPKGYFECNDASEIITLSNYNADADTENSADSIFCANGAGFLVKWNEVDNYKHIESNLELEIATDEPLETIAERYFKTVATDKELMQIFERTYGPIKKHTENTRQPKNAVPTPKKPRITVQKTNYSGSEYLLIDGYNIIHSWKDLKALSEKSLDIARRELITRMCNYKGFHKCEVIIVFDAYKVKDGEERVEKHHSITVVYTKEAETADTYIEKASHRLAKDHRVKVATSDGQEQLIILGSGAIRLSATGLLAEVNETERQIREFLHQT